MIIQEFITPVFLIIILVSWVIQQGMPTLAMEDVPEDQKIYILATRIGLLLLADFIAVMVNRAWKRRSKLGIMPNYPSK